jgi:hypothetical protein
VTKAAITAADALGALPEGLRRPLVESLNVIARNFREHRWEPAELNGGKLCEVVYTILKGFVDGKFPSVPSKPRNLLNACKAMESADQNKFPRSVRIQIPRMLIALYEIRNNRGVGHVGGDVDPNEMDALVVLEMSKWIVAELVRIFHKVDVKVATEVVTLLVERTIPIIWAVDGKLRVLNPDLSKKDQMLLVLYSIPGAITDKELVDFIEYRNLTVFRNEVLRPAHKARLVEYDEPTKSIRISPRGIQYVEDNLPLAM